MAQNVLCIRRKAVRYSGPPDEAKAEKGENAMNLPGFENYMGSTSKNYGLNSLKFYTNDGTFWYSYRTLVAFKKLGGDIVCRQNEWGPTTGKHLNAIEPNHDARVDTETFERLYQEIFG